MISTNELLLILAAIMLLGFIGEIGFRKKRIPDMLLLLLIGILIHYAGIIPASFMITLRNLLSFVGTIALTLIVFGGVLRLDIGKFGGAIPRGIFVAAMDIVFVMAIGTVFFYFVMKVTLLISLFLSAMLSETSATFVIPLVSRVSADEKIKRTVEVETIFNSVLNVIITLLILNIMNQQESFIALTGYLFSSISEAIILGGVVGIVWLIVLKQASTPHYYVATIAVLLGLWGISDYLNASAILSVFIFSVIIANSVPLSNITKISGKVNTEQLISFNQEITFIVLTFFYVYIGILVNILDFKALIVALVITIVLIISRLAEIYAVNGATKWFGRDTALISSFVHRGSTVIVLIGIVLSESPSLFSSYGNTVFYVVIFTILFGSVFYSLISRRYSTNTSVENQNVELVGPTAK
ncbi:MAG: cation:proton antiporter [Thermoplasmatales archaeon]